MNGTSRATETGNLLPEREGLTQYCSLGLKTQAKNSANESWGCPIQNEVDYLWTVGGYETVALQKKGTLNSKAFATCSKDGF